MANKPDLSDFMSFKHFITTKLMIIIYALGAVYITYQGVTKIFAKSRMDFDFGSYSDSSILLGLGIILIGNLLWRIICEAAIVLFRMHDSLRTIELRQLNDDRSER